MVEREEKILSQTKPSPIVHIYVSKRSIGARFLRGMLGGSLLGKAIFEKPFAEALRTGGVEAGDIGDIIEKPLKVEELILTTESIIILYRKWMKDKAVVLPLQYAKSVEGERFMKSKSLLVKFQVPGEEKPVEFDVFLVRLKEAEAWLRELSRIISSPLGA